MQEVFGGNIENITHHVEGHQFRELPDEIILHVMQYIEDSECFHSTCFTKKSWVLNIWPQRKTRLNVNDLSELDRYLYNVNVSKSTNQTTSKKTKSATIGSTAGAIAATLKAMHIEEKRVGTKVLFDSFEKFTNLTEISLVNCGLNDSILDKLCHTFRKKLIRLNVAKNKSLSLTWPSVQKSILACECLTHLDISYNFQNSNTAPSTERWVDTSLFPKQLVWVNISGLLKQIPDFESLHVLIERFSEAAASKNNPYEGYQVPFIRTFVANHLTDISLLTLDKCNRLASKSLPSLLSLYNHCLIYGKSEAFTKIHETLRFHPSDDFIYTCLESGHTKILDLLSTVGFPINNIPIEVVENSILNGHSSIISKLRVLGFVGFNDISEQLLDNLVRKGDTQSILELRLCNLDRQKWESITLSSMEEAIRNGNKDVLEHIRMLNLTELINNVAVENVEYSLEKGHNGVLKQLIHSNYSKINDLNPTIIANAIIKSSTVEAMLRNANYKNLVLSKQIAKQIQEQEKSQKKKRNK